MNKLESLKHIRAAKRAHLNWVSHAHALILGVPLEENQIPVYATDCQFGKWYYHDGQGLASIQAFRDIEQPHIELHNSYYEIFQLLFKKEEKKTGFWGKLFGKKAAINTDDDKNKAQALYAELKGYSEIVVSHLDSLANELELIDDKTFSEMLRYSYKIA